MTTPPTKSPTPAAKPNPAAQGLKGSATTPGKPGMTPGGSSTIKEAKRAAPFRIETTQTRARFLKLLIYGNYGVGKTTLAATAAEVPSMGDIIMINAEAGDLSIEEYDELDAVTITTYRQLARVNEFLKQHCKARDENDIEQLRKMEAYMKGIEDPESIKKPRQYRTVIIDTLSEAEAYCFNQLLGVTDSTRLDDEVQGAEWAEYKKNNAMILRLVRGFRDLPMHVIFTCAEQYQQDETKKMKYSPDLTGKLSKKVQGFMDMVGYLVIGAGENGEQKRRLYVSPSAQGRYDAKHRYRKFKGTHFDNPTIKSILKETGLLSEQGAAVK